MTIPGFEAVFAIIGLLIVAYLVLRGKENEDNDENDKDDEDDENKKNKRGHR